MVQDHFTELEGKTVRYADRTWELSGEVAVENDGEVLALAARRVDDDRHEAAQLVFVADESGDSLNPGNLVEHFDRLERTSGSVTLVLKTDGRTYRYVLSRLAKD